MEDKDARPPLSDLLEAKRERIAKNRADFERHLKRAPTRVLWICACCHCALDAILRTGRRADEGRYPIFSSADRSDISVTREEVKAAARLLRHPAMGYRVRIATRRHQGRETYRIYYYHSHDL